MARFGREKLDEVVADPLIGLVAQGAHRGRVDRLQTAGQIVRADETEAVLDEVAVAPLAFGERIFGLLPRGMELAQPYTLGIVSLVQRALVTRKWLLL